MMTFTPAVPNYASTAYSQRSPSLTVRLLCEQHHGVAGLPRAEHSHCRNASSSPWCQCGQSVGKMCISLTLTIVCRIIKKFEFQGFAATHTPSGRQRDLQHITRFAHWRACFMKTGTIYEQVHQPSETLQVVTMCI